jgi:hypothetical protein
VEVTQVPLQQCVLFEQAPPCGVQAFWHAPAGAHSKSPVLFKSVQQPLTQSVFALQLV